MQDTENRPQEVVFIQVVQLSQYDIEAIDAMKPHLGVVDRAAVIRCAIHHLYCDMHDQFGRLSLWARFKRWLNA